MRPCVYRKGTALTLAGVLEAAFSEAQQVQQWLDLRSYQLAANHDHAVRTLIELLEVHLHGSCEVSCYRGLRWENGGARHFAKGDYHARIRNIVAFCKKKKLLPRDWNPNPEV